MAFRMLRGAVLLLGWCWAAQSHPMGNFSVNRHARFDVRADGVRLTYTLELAGQPSFELIAGWGMEAAQDRGEISSRLSDFAPEWLAGLRVSVNGVAVSPKLDATETKVSEGAGGLPVLRAVLSVWLESVPGELEYADTNFADRRGWSEIVVLAGPGAQLRASTHGAEDRSRALTLFPYELRDSPPRDLRARFRWAAGASAAEAEVIPSGEAPGGGAGANAGAGGAVAGTNRDYLSRLLRGRELTVWMLLGGLAVAFGLGAAHALSPGHGKTIVAAYLVGSRGTMKHALLLGGLVTLTHTASVFALGIGVWLFESYIVPDRVIPVLGAVSGLSIVAIGTWLLYRRAQALHHQYQHVRGPGHDPARVRHAHHHDHGHDHHAHVPAPGGEVTMTGLLALGISGGLVPCPSALVLLLSSIAIGRVALGLGLLIAFSAGLAVVLIAIGAAVLYAKHLLPESAGANSPAFRLVPVVSAALIVVLGLVMTGVSLGWIQPVFG
jgi:nickel/cobalt transporter (NicO) family protein